MKYFWYYLIFINLFAFCTYGIDKWKAKKGAWRVPEKTLLILALIGGSAGAIAGMMCFRHKTRKAKFMITVPVIFVVEVILLIIWLLKKEKRKIFFIASSICTVKVLKLLSKKQDFTKSCFFFSTSFRMKKNLLI